ncbi:MAG TPA: benzoate/H(+) symporter BenE family transporter [Burkholderiaceae bacterium]|jgi:benzoate membrane transport protein
MGRWFQDLSKSSAVAGCVAVLIGFTGTVFVVFLAAQKLGATPAQTGSWILALGLGMAASTIILTLWTRMPILTAWSTPGAALLAGVSGLSLPEAVGAFLLCGLLILIAGLTGWFTRIMDRIPLAVASALLAGVLARFGLDAVLTLQSTPLLAVALLVAYLLGRRFRTRYAGVLMIAVGIVVAWLEGRIDFQAESVQLVPAALVWVAPVFSWQALLGVGLPLFIVTMASQNLPAVAAQRAMGFAAPVSRILAVTGLATLLTAPFGGYAIGLAAFTGTICMGPEAHPNPARRYPSALVAALIYIVLGLLGLVFVGLFLAFPRGLVAGVGGLALLSSLAGGLASSLKEDRTRDAAMLTFLVTLSGIGFLGLASPFWGVLAGAMALMMQNYRSK